MMSTFIYSAHQKCDWRKFYRPVNDGNLGSGMTGDVFVVKHIESGKLFACKPLKKALDNTEIVETMRREISLLAQVPN